MVIAKNQNQIKNSMEKSKSEKETKLYSSKKGQAVKYTIEKELENYLAVQT